jgi:RimJ/RimL family protein N-acetyltransferase
MPTDTEQPIDERVFKDTILRSILDELKQFHLQPKEYISLANELLDLAINRKSGGGSDGIPEPDIPKQGRLPLVYDDIRIREIRIKDDPARIKDWTAKGPGREFLLSRIENVEERLEDLLSDDKNIFGMIESGGVPIGIMGYLNHDPVNKKAELRKLIGEGEYRGHGLGKKSTKLWLSYGIHTLGLRKIYIYTFDTNMRNIRINRELGFHLEGVFKEENISSGTVKDIVRMAFIKSDK